MADTASIGFTHVTGGSRADVRDRYGGHAQAAEKVRRGPEEARRDYLGNPGRGGRVEGRDGGPGGFQRAGAFEPLDLAALALKAAKTGGPIAAEVSVNAQGAGAEDLAPISAT